MTNIEPSAMEAKFCSALMSQVVQVYFSFKHANWLTVQERVRREAKFKSVYATELNEHWDSAVDAVDKLVEYLQKCLSDENTGKNLREYRLCIIDRGEVGACMAIEAARLQGRVGFNRPSTLAFAYEKSAKFHVNAMIARREGDRELHDLWLEAVQLIESNGFEAQGNTYLNDNCGFCDSYDSITAEDREDYCLDRTGKEYQFSVRGLREVGRIAFSTPPGGPSFQLAERFGKRAWAYNVLCGINRNINRERDLDPDDVNCGAEFEEDKYYPLYKAANKAAESYCLVGQLLASVQETGNAPVRPLLLLAADIGERAAKAYVDELTSPTDDTLPEDIFDSAMVLKYIAELVNRWFSDSMAAIDSIIGSEREQKVAALYAEHFKIVAEVLASPLCSHPEKDNSSWIETCTAQLTARVEAVALSGKVMAMETERGAYYLERMRDTDPALSPAHKKMRDCWEKAAAMLDSARSHSNAPATYKVFVWLAANYAHLADGVLADVAAYHKNASQATAAGDAEQAVCWGNAAKFLGHDADAVLLTLKWYAANPSKKTFVSKRPARHKTDESLLEKKAEFEGEVARWVRTGTILRLLGAGGTALSRALVRLTYGLENVERSPKEVPDEISSTPRFVAIRSSILASLEKIYARILADATAARRACGTSGKIDAAQMKNLSQLVVFSDMVCESCGRLWEFDGDEFRYGEYPSEDLWKAGEHVAETLAGCVAAVEKDASRLADGRTDVRNLL